MRAIEIYDTTLRDGTQGEGVSLSLQDKLQITARLDEIGVDYIEGGYPLSNEKDAEYFRRVGELPLQNAKICAFGMTRRKGVEAAQDPGMRRCWNPARPSARWSARHRISTRRECSEYRSKKTWR